MGSPERKWLAFWNQTPNQYSETEINNVCISTYCSLHAQIIWHSLTAQFRRWLCELWSNYSISLKIVCVIVKKKKTPVCNSSPWFFQLHYYYYSYNLHINIKWNFTIYYKLSSYQICSHLISIMFFGRNYAKAETPVLWLPHAKSWLIGKDWCWEGLGAGGEGDDRGWDGWMASPTRWMWVWVNSRSWWRTEKPGVLQFMGSQRVGLDWTELNQHKYMR